MSRIADISKSLEFKIKLLNQELDIEVPTSIKVDCEDIDMDQISDYKEEILEFINENEFFDVILMDLYIEDVDYIPLSQNFYLSKEVGALKLSYKAEPLDMTKSKIYFEANKIKDHVSESESFDKKLVEYVDLVKQIKVYKAENKDFFHKETVNENDLDDNYRKILSKIKNLELD